MEVPLNLLCWKTFNISEFVWGTISTLKVLYKSKSLHQFEVLCRKEGCHNVWGLYHYELWERRLMRAGAPPIWCLQSAAAKHPPPTISLPPPPSCSWPEVDSSRSAARCISSSHSAFLAALASALPSLSSLGCFDFFKNLTCCNSASFQFLISTPPEFSSSPESSSLQAALCGLLEQAGGEGHRPKWRHGQPLSLGLRDALPEVAQICRSGQLWGCHQLRPRGLANTTCQKIPRSCFSMSLVLWNSGSLNLAALDISQDNQSFRGLKARLPKPRGLLCMAIAGMNNMRRCIGHICKYFLVFLYSSTFNGTQRLFDLLILQ